MPPRVSSRHEGDLEGALKPFEETDAADVTVAVVPETAHLASAQHTAWMLVNLLARMDGIVRKIGFVCPERVPLAGRIVPLARRSTDLAAAILEGASAIDTVPVEVNKTFRTQLTVGPAAAGGWLTAYGEGWWGGFSQGGTVPCTGASDLPFGPYIAACLASAEVFKAARMRPADYDRPERAYYSAWAHAAAETADQAGPPDLHSHAFDLLLAGVGAVGSAWVHAIWACPGIAGRVVLVDNDAAGVDLTNLNRYPLFGRGSVGRQKSYAAAELVADSEVEWIPRDGPAEAQEFPRMIISAVDTNRARAAIQNRYPARTLAGSTLDLRSEVLRCGPPGTGACLRCYNPPEQVATDDTLRGALAKSDAERLSAVAAAAGVELDDAREWINTGKCGTASSRLLPYLRAGAVQPARFALGFTSVMAGTLLAAETVKQHLGVSAPLDDRFARAVFQFWRPTSPSNGATTYARDPRCPMCDPTTAGGRAWRERY